MSNETQDWLNSNVLVGFTRERGNAWHWREGTDNHYEDEIPVDDVRRRLFHWEPVKAAMHYFYEDTWKVFPGKSVIIRSDNGAPLGAHSDGYSPHGYSEWLIQNVQNVMDDSVRIGSAGLLKGGAVAWVQIEFPETRHADSGVDYRPTILATTSLDGSVASSYKAVNTIVVCDNTHAAAMGEQGPAYRVKHTKNSSFQVLTAREKLGVALERQAEAFEQEVQALLSQEVTPKQFGAYLDLINPIPEAEETAAQKRAKTFAENKRDKLLGMWISDPRVSVWKNTVWGVYQLINTYETHERKFKGDRAESTLMSMVTGQAFKKDQEAMAQLQKVLSNV
jgi:phage/plasmid-like protein (TIGR03299 family)